MRRWPPARTRLAADHDRRHAASGPHPAWQAAPWRAYHVLPWSDALGLPVPEAVKKPAEQPALRGQRRGRGRRDSTLPGYRLVVVRPRDHVHDLLLVEVLGPFDHGHEADQIPVLH